MALRDLAQGEDRFRMLTTLSADWFWEQDAELRFVQITEGAHNTGGLAREAHIGKRRWELPDTEIALELAIGVGHGASIVIYARAKDTKLRQDQRYSGVLSMRTEAGLIALTAAKTQSLRFTGIGCLKAVRKVGDNLN